MARKRKVSIIDNLLNYPWQLHLIIVITLFFSPYLLNYYIRQSNNIILIKVSTSKIGYFLPSINIVLIIFFIIFMGLSFYKKYERKYLFSHQHNLQNLYELTWRQFEYLVTEVFHRAGYKVKPRGGAKADGGIDLEAYDYGRKIIIQCKHWRTKSVGVSVVREMLGVAIHEQAQEVYIITCGYFTKDAKDFAEGKPIQLIHGYKLLSWIKTLKGE